MSANPPNEALRQNRFERGADEIRFGAEVEQPRHRADGVVRVKRREKEVSRERGLNCDAARFRIADLADHDHVRILPEQRSEQRRKGAPDTLVYLKLVDTGQIVLNGILNGAEIALDTFDRLERRV